jgi:hypothetical protein
MAKKQKKNQLVKHQEHPNTPPKEKQQKTQH